MPLRLPKRVRSRGSSGGIWLGWVLPYPVHGKALLDLEELLEQILGRAWLLQDL